MNYYRLTYMDVLHKKVKETKKLFGFIPITFSKDVEEPFTVLADIILYDEYCPDVIDYVDYIVRNAVHRYLFDMEIPEDEYPKNCRIGEPYKDNYFSSRVVNVQPLMFEEIDTLLLFNTEQKNLYHQIDVFGEENINMVYDNKYNTNFINIGSKFDMVYGVLIDETLPEKDVTLLLEEYEVVNIIFNLRSDANPDKYISLPYRRLMNGIRMDEKIIEYIKKENRHNGSD